MSELQLNRPTRSNIPQIVQFLSRNSNGVRMDYKDIEIYLETCYFSAVYINAVDQTVYGFFASTNYTDKDGMLCATTHEIKCLVADAVIQKVFLHKCVETLYKTINKLENIVYPTDGLLFEFLKSAGFNEIGDRLEYNRAMTPVPRLNIRYANIEDADKIYPLLKKNNMDYLYKDDYEMAKLIEPDDHDLRPFVAEANGEIIAFVKCTNKVPIERFSKKHRIDAFFADILGRRVFKSMENIETRFGIGDQGLSETGAAVSMTSLAEVEVLKQNNLEEVQIEIDEVEVVNDREESVVKASDLAFQITIFCIEPQFASQSSEFIEKLFAAFPNAKFCLLSLPTNSSLEIPLFQEFVAVPPRIISSESLFVISSSSLHQVTVRKFLNEDLEQVYALLDGLVEEEAIVCGLKTGGQFYSITSKDAVVGLVEITENSDMWSILQQFYLESTVLTSEKSIKGSKLISHFVLDPLFQNQIRWIFQQLFSLLHTSIISALISKQRTCLSYLARNSMFPVLPYKHIQYSKNLKDGNPVPDKVKAALFTIAPDMIYEPRLRQTSNIVIAGSSNTALGFCELFVTHPNIYFSNLYLLSPGNPSAFTQDFDGVLVDSLSYWPFEVCQLGILEGLTIIDDEMIKINRKLKCIQTEKGIAVPYDFLVLASGQQFDPAEFIGDVLLYNVVGIDHGNEKQIIRSFDFLVHHKLFSLDKPDLPYVCVYGRDIQAFPLVNYLLGRGLQPSAILLIRPLESAGALFSENEFCDHKIQELTQSTGVQIWYADIVNWSCHGSELVSIDLKTSEGVTKTIQCAYLYYSDKKSTKRNIFKAINNCSLVFDSNLVIDHNFKTHDPSIYAAGSLTKYSSRFKTKWKQAYNDSREVGNKLAETLMQYFDPLTHFSPSDDIPQFSDCKRISAHVPGNHLFFRFDKPHLPNDVYDQRKKNGTQVAGRILETKTSRGYFQVHVMPNTRIRSVTFLGPVSQINPTNFLPLFNLPSSCCNNLVERFDAGLIDCLVEFFEGTWAYALFDYRFKRVMDELSWQLISSTDNIHIQKIIRELENGSKNKQKLYADFDESLAKTNLDEAIWETLKKFLPGY